MLLSVSENLLFVFTNYCIDKWIDFHNCNRTVIFKF